MRKFVLFIISLLYMANSYATHFAGGEIRYKFNGTNYDIYLTIYKVCESSQAIDLQNTAIAVISSVSQNVSFTDTLTFLGYDTIATNCINNANLCYNPSNGTLPGYIQAKFKSTVTFPVQANDWYIRHMNNARIRGLVNCGANEPFLLEAWLDNTMVINSTPRMVAAPSYYLSVNDTATIPLQTIDPEGDSIVYTFIAPKRTVNTPVSYTHGYSVSNPLGTGGICSIDPITHTLILKPVMQGMFAIAFNVDEYRNGVKVGTYLRDITLAVLPSTSKLSFPLENSKNPEYVYTCPGQTNNTVVLNYTDPSVLDSVYLDVEFPNLTGWNFSASTINGNPSASTKISWTTPSTLNPAILPHFFITIRAKDNACPSSIAEYSLLVRTRQCNADSVWPGDANGDFTVNIYDPLAIAIAAGQTGPVRPGANTTWTAQACANWANVFVTNNINVKHADCNGDGNVNNSDLAAVTANYTQSHPKGGRSKTTGNYDLYLDMTNVRMAPGATVSIPIKFGSATQTVSDVYGIATQIHISGQALTGSPVVSNTNSWIDNSGSAINFSHGITSTAVDWALGRTNQVNISGQGTIGVLNFTIPTNAIIGSAYIISFANTVVIDKNGIERYDANPIDQKGVLLNPQSIATVARAGVQSASIVPNPSFNTANLNIVLEEDAAVNVTVSDITGKTVWSANDNYGKGEQHIALPAGQVENGMYMVQLSTDGGRASIMKWVKQ